MFNYFLPLISGIPAHISKAEDGGDCKKGLINQIDPIFDSLFGNQTDPSNEKPFIREH